MSAPVEPPAGVGYPALLQRAPFDPVRPVLVLLLGMTAYLGVAVLARVLAWLGWVVQGSPGDAESALATAAAFETPWGMACTQLALACLVPAVLLVMRHAGGLAPRWVASVQPGMRWRYLTVVALMALVVLGVALTVAARQDLAHPTPQAGFGWYLLVIVLTSPVQAAGEEFLFRGLLMTALGSWVRSPWFGVVASAVVFALCHGVQSAPLFCDRFAFGLIAAVLVWRTGGLEAGIAIHAVNNVLAFALAGGYGTIAAVRAVRDISWAEAGVDVGTFAVAALAAWGIGRAFRVATDTPTGVLQNQRAVR